jgi:D-tyrosyl-tRNA(Tyr) deacylase
MKAVLQRVTHASVRVDGRVVGHIGKGLVVFLGIAKGDGQAALEHIVNKIHSLRIFGDDKGRMNRPLTDAGGAVLLVSQFTLLSDTSKGRRPGFDQAAPPDEARRLYEEVAARLRAQGITVETGRFGAHMEVELLNDGPVTFILDSGHGISPVEG